MALDFGNLVPEEAQKQSDTAVNPTIPWLQESFSANKWRQVTVPSTEARSLVSLLVRGAEDAELGVSTRVRVGGDEFVPSKDFWTKLAAAKPRDVKVMFLGKTRVLRPRKATANVSDVPAE